MSTFQSTLAQRFSTIADIGRLSETASPLTRLGLSTSDLSGILARPPIDIGPIGGQLPPSTPPTQPPLTPGDAGNYLGSIAQTPEEVLAAAVHAARVAFEAIPTAQDGDVIDAAIPNGFRSALITLLSLADATVQRLVQPRPPRPVPLPTQPPVGVSPPPVSVTPPPTVGGTGILHIDPSVIGSLVVQPALTPPTPGDPAVTTPPDTSVLPAFPSIDLGGRLFDAQTLTHPETGTTTTVFVERAADAPAATSGLAGTIAGTTAGTLAATTAGTLAASSFTLSPVAGGGFALAPSVSGSIAGH